ncbi:MAG: Maf family nucleotide pyrophosphatase [Hyphomicrobiales bacterium]
MLKAELTLASKSPTRRTILENAGLRVVVSPPSSTVEDAAKRHYAGNAHGLALHLARAKAEAVAQTTNGLVLGADQTLLLGEHVYSKPRSIEDAQDHLAALQGRTHELVSSLAVWRDGNEVWSFTDSARLTMRPLTKTEIVDYIGIAGSDVLSSVGSYQLEGVGIQLFERVDGDYFTILGLPLLPLLRALRSFT